MTKCKLLVVALLCGLVIGSLDSYSKSLELEQVERRLSVKLNENNALHVKYEALNDDIIQGTCLTRFGLGK